MQGNTLIRKHTNGLIICDNINDMWVIIVI